MGVNRWRVLSAIGIVASLRRSLGDVAANATEVQWSRVLNAAWFRKSRPTKAAAPRMPL